MADGSSSAPWEVYTINDLKAIGSADWSAEVTNPDWHMDDYYILMNDIDLEGATILPIGHGNGWGYTKFEGNFNGLGHRIFNGYINRPTDNYVGLFAYVGSNGIVREVAVELVVTGNMFVGNLIGRNDGEVYNCYVQATVVGNATTVSGVVGRNEGYIFYCYARGTITSSNTPTSGILGSQPLYRYAEHCYYHEDMTADDEESITGEPRTTAQLMSIANYPDWDISLKSDYQDTKWFIDEGVDYPRLYGEYVESALEAAYIAQTLRSLAAEDINIYQTVRVVEKLVRTSSGEITVSPGGTLFLGKAKNNKAGWALAIYAGVADGENYDIKYQISLSMNSEEALQNNSIHFIDKEDELITEPMFTKIFDGVQFIKISVDATSVDDIQVCWRRLL